MVGDDAWAQDLRTQLALSPTIDVHFVTDPSRPTSVKTRYVADAQQVMRADRESRLPVCAAIEKLLLEKFTALLRDADAIVLSDYAKGVLSDSVTRAAIETARAAVRPSSSIPKRGTSERYRGATLLTPQSARITASVQPGMRHG